MGMPHALGAIGAWRALLVMAPLTLLGATVASHAVEKRVGSGLTAGPLSVTEQVVVIGAAFAVTTAYNRLKVPTSTIQILVFSVVGAALASGTGCRVGLSRAPRRRLGRGAARRARARRGAHARARPPAAGRQDRRRTRRRRDGRGVRNGRQRRLQCERRARRHRHLRSSRSRCGRRRRAGCRRPHLGQAAPAPRRFEIVEVDRAMATAAQLVQAAVVLAAVAFGFFTSMNQALVAAMAGAGFARGRDAVHVETLVGIVQGWLLGPAGGLAIAYVGERIVQAIHQG
jgi:PiT family inorganic phosphate transporter